MWPRCDTNGQRERADEAAHVRRPLANKCRSISLSCISESGNPATEHMARWKKRVKLDDPEPWEQRCAGLIYICPSACSLPPTFSFRYSRRLATDAKPAYRHTALPCDAFRHAWWMNCNSAMALFWTARGLGKRRYHRGTPHSPECLRACVSDGTLTHEVFFRVRILIAFMVSSSMLGVVPLGRVFLLWSDLHFVQNIRPAAARDRTRTDSERLKQRSMSWQERTGSVTR
jgi:hypothetical protein